MRVKPKHPGYKIVESHTDGCYATFQFSSDNKGLTLKLFNGAGSQMGCGNVVLCPDKIREMIADLSDALCCIERQDFS